MTRRGCLTVVLWAPPPNSSTCDGQTQISSRSSGSSRQAVAPPHFRAHASRAQGCQPFCLLGNERPRETATRLGPPLLADSRWRSGSRSDPISHTSCAFFVLRTQTLLTPGGPKPVPCWLEEPAYLPAASVAARPHVINPPAPSRVLSHPRPRPRPRPHQPPAPISS